MVHEVLKLELAQEEKQAFKASAEAINKVIKETGLSMDKIIIWFKASRLKLHILGLLPVLVGSFIAFHRTGEFKLTNLIFAELITLFSLIATAFANDYADIEGDKINRSFNMFSGGSRVIVDGFISRRQMFIATIVASFLSLIFSILFLILGNGNPIILFMNLVGLFVGIEYSLSPLKINYRGGGEFLVMFMYSFFCLFFGFITQVGHGFDVNILYLSIPIALAIFLTILITEIPDQEADRHIGKKTLPAILGKEASINLFLVGLQALYISVLVLYLFGTIKKNILWGLFLSLPLGLYLSLICLSKKKILPKHISILCAAAIILNVWINVVFTLNLMFRY